MNQHLKPLIAFSALVGLVACGSPELSEVSSDKVNEEFTDSASEESLSSSSAVKNESGSSAGSAEDAADSIIDSRDGEIYRTTKIGNQIWMAENLRYALKDGELSWCRSDVGSECVKIEQDSSKLVWPDRASESVKKIPVTLYDWSYSAQEDGSVSEDFGNDSCYGSMDGSTLVLGMVESELGSNGVPVRAINFPENCGLSKHIDSWFLPEVIAEGADGKSYSNMACRDIVLSRNGSSWYAEMSSSVNSEGNDSYSEGFFPLDDFEYLDDAATVKNPYYDQLSYSSIKHNFGFTMKMQATFTYEVGQHLEFQGDDDVWIYIDNRLVVDLGGIHAAIAGAVDLDTLGLIVGNTYPFHIFFAERHVAASNFNLQTNIDLKAPSRIFVTKAVLGDSLIQAEIWEVKHGNESCVEYADTLGGRALFTLYGPGDYSGGVTLNSGKYFDGAIVIGDSTFSINRASLSRSQILTPGAYYIRASLRSDSDEYADLDFVVDSYECTEKAGCEGGRYYAKLAVVESDTNVCPEGWHVPNADEWNALWATVGGKTTAGMQLKSLNGWNGDTSVSGSYNFKALPEGLRTETGNYEGVGETANFWSSSEFGNSGAYGWKLQLGKDDIAYLGADYANYGLSVRCLKDE